MTVKLSTAAVLVGFCLAGAAVAAPVDRTTTTKMAEAPQAQAAAAIEDDDAATCSRSRKRLFVEGEGWIVRKVTICR